jgi:hypothetical protein
VLAPTTTPAAFLERSIPIVLQARVKLQYLDRHKDIEYLSIFALLMRDKPIQDEDGDGSQQHPCDVVEEVADDG